MCRTIRTAIRCEPLAVRDARDWIREQLTELYPSIDTAVVDDAGLAVSELVTNCVRADAHELTLSMIAHRFDVVVATTDDAPGVPHRVTAPPSATSGRGLQIVEALTTEWGVSPGDGHKTVWGRFSLTDSTRCSFDCDR